MFRSPRGKSMFSHDAAGVPRDLLNPEQRDGASFTLINSAQVLRMQLGNEIEVFGRKDLVHERGTGDGLNRILVSKIVRPSNATSFVPVVTASKHHQNNQENARR